ncbi:MAG TPA: GNAT family N-acetyltransferase [Mycobacteriales bacterium]|nr:GNAT family N-acetyltransferase [Mycobacteriales bacterium]
MDDPDRWAAARDDAQLIDVRDHVIRPARASDTPHIRTIEAAAGTQFYSVGMDLVADAELPSDEELIPYINGQRAWVVTDAHDVPIAFILSDIVDDNVHIEQVSVHPSQAHKGLGKALIDHVADVAGDSGYPAMTLTTYVDVPWNGPYYTRLGFMEIGTDELTPGLVEIRRHEAELGLDAWPRVCMRRALAANEPAAEVCRG